MQTVEGTIVSEKISSKSDTYFYKIERQDGYIIDVVRFEHRIDARYVVKICYTQKNTSDYNCNNIVESIEKIEFITEKNDVKNFLRKIINLSEKTTSSIYDKFGEDTIDILINNPTFISTSKEKSKDSQLIIPPGQIKKIREYFGFFKYPELVTFFDKYGIYYSMGMLNKIDTEHTHVDDIKNNPYILYGIPGFTFNKIDEIASKIGGIDKFWIYRIEPLIDHIYKKAYALGKIYLSRQDIFNICTKNKIIIDNHTIDIINTQLIKIVVDNIEYYTSKKFYHLERFIEKFVLDNQDKYEHPEIDFDDDIDPEQKLAINTIVSNRISIINGPPGTGKSYVIAKAIESLPETNIVLALTGSAVQNIKGSLKETNCSTIHRFLFRYHNFNQRYHNNNKNDESKDDDSKDHLNNIIESMKNRKKINIFIDEMSMVPFCLFCEVLKIIYHIPKIRLVLVGDCNQLPCIEGGSVFNDLISHSNIPRVTLKTQHRAETQHIIETAFLVLNGKNIEADNKSVYIIKNNNQEKILNMLIEVIKNRNLTPNNTCVISPRKQNNSLSCHKINQLLQKYYNGKSNVLVKTNDFDIRLNDKLIYKKNDPKLNLYNGSVIYAKKYVVETVDIDDNGDDIINYYLECECDDTLYNIIESDLENIELGYATSVHSAQGKGYDNVIILLHEYMGQQILYRKLLYTAITRAKKRCIIICDGGSLQMCKKIVPSRITNLFQFNEHPSYLIQYIYNNTNEVDNLNFDDIITNYKSVCREVQYNMCTVN